MGLVGRNDELKKEEGWPEGWTQSRQSVEIIVDKGVQRITKKMDGKRENRKSDSTDRRLLGTEI